jgi:hypothetical protein
MMLLQIMLLILFGIGIYVEWKGFYQDIYITPI